jgi:hypothetical protein
MADSNQLLLKSIRRRGQKREPFRYGIITADRYVRSLQGVLGIDGCYHRLSRGKTSYDDLLKQASETLVYSNEEMDASDIFSKDEDLSHATGISGLELPKDTLMAFRHCLTSSRKDRDGDVLHSDGARVDPRMLLLWQHVHTMPIGKLVVVEQQNPKKLVVISAIVDMNDLCHDAAVMIDNGMGRFSHGFRAIRFDKVKEDKEGVDGEGGFDVKEFEIMEESLVSVPANPDAETEEVLLSLVEGGKLTSPVMKDYGRGIRSRRPTVVPATVEVKVYVNGTEQKGTKNENESRGGAGEGQGQGERGQVDDAGASEKADAEATDREGVKGEAGNKEVTEKKMEMACDSSTTMGMLSGSWESISYALSNGIGRFLTLVGMGIGEHDYAWIVATFPDYAIVRVNRQGGMTQHYKVAWELRDDVPTFVGEPEAVQLQTTTEIVEAGYWPPHWKPYPNEHALRLNDPDEYKRIRRQNDKFGEGIHAIFGVTEDGDVELQAIRFSADKFTAEEAKKWLKDNDYDTSGFEEASGKSGVEGVKSGRTLSKANCDRIAKAKAHVDDVCTDEKVPMSRGAQLREASGHLKDVLDSAAKPFDEEEEEKPEKPRKSVDAMVALIAEATPDERKRMSSILEAIEITERSDRVAKQFAALGLFRAAED